MDMPRKEMAPCPTLSQQVSTCLLHAMHGHLWRHLDTRLVALLTAAASASDPSPDIIDFAARRSLSSLTVARLLTRPTGQACHDYRRGEVGTERWQDRLDDALMGWCIDWVRQAAGCSTPRALRILDLLSDALARQGLDDTRWQDSRGDMTLAQLHPRQTPTSR